MTFLAGTLFVVALGLQQPGAALATDELTRVRELYALASYEEALARLDAAGPRINAERAAQYRALCLLGLSRVADAERTLERLVMEHPTYALPEDEVSPRLYAMFRDTRQRLLPAAARARYTAAKTAFDQRQFVQAARGFREVQALLADAAFAAEVDGLRDLKVLSAGFLDLAEGEIRGREVAAAPAPAPTGAAPAAAPSTAPAVAASTPAPAPPAAAAAGPTTPVAPPAAAAAAPAASLPAPTVTEIVIYSEADALVQPPVDVQRRLPPWSPPPALARMAFRGALEVIIDETGGVASASIVESVHPIYDTSLVEAARRWRFQPATREGLAVPYRKTFEIVLNRR